VDGPPPPSQFLIEAKMKPYAEFLKATDDIHSSVTTRHVFMLYGLIRWLRPNTVLEIGAWHGYSTVWMARALQEMEGQRKLYTIDDFSDQNTDLEILRANLRLAGVEEVVEILHGDSMKVDWPEPPLDFVYIDGNHSLAHAEYDFYKALEYGASCVVMHDTTSWWGSRAVVDNFRRSQQSQWDYIEVPFDEGLTIFLPKPLDKPPVTFSQTSYPSGLI
jgi:predicted O-methyltransferase YrrM